MEKNKKLIKKLDAEIKREKDMKDFLEQDRKELEKQIAELKAELEKEKELIDKIKKHCEEVQEYTWQVCCYSEMEDILKLIRENKMITKIDEDTLKVNDVDKLVETLDELRLSAKDMFEAMGYELKTEQKDYLFYKNGWQTIEFTNINEPKIYAEYGITLDELTAVNKQIEELRVVGYGI